MGIIRTRISKSSGFLGASFSLRHLSMERTDSKATCGISAAIQKNTQRSVTYRTHLGVLTDAHFSCKLRVDLKIVPMVHALGDMFIGQGSGGDAGQKNTLLGACYCDLDYPQPFLQSEMIVDRATRYTLAS